VIRKKNRKIAKGRYYFCWGWKRARPADWKKKKWRYKRQVAESIVLHRSDLKGNMIAKEGAGDQGKHNVYIIDATPVGPCRNPAKKRQWN